MSTPEHWRNLSVYQRLRHLAAYGIGSANVNQPSGPIQQAETFQGADTRAGGFFPVHVKKNIFRLSGRGRLSRNDRL